MSEELLKIQKLESISLLAGGIAHDFNNILTSILGNISLARVFVDSPIVDDKLINAENACEVAKALTQQLLTFSKGGLPVKELTPLDKILKDSTLFASSGSNAKCEFLIQDDLWWVEIDKGQINQVINNLIINAIQAMPDGGIIKICASNFPVGYSRHDLPLKEGNYVKVSVSDHGTGIPDEVVPKIFDPFFTTKPKGHGLGLSTCYSIIKKHGGHIAVDMQSRAETTFSFYLPASPAKITTTGIQEQDSPFNSGGRILIMDDDDNIRQLCFEILSRAGYGVVLSSDGIEAIEAYKNARESDQPFDLVIMDLTIPGGMGGREAIGKILEIDPQAKAIVSSGYSNDEVISQFQQFGFKAAISKPYKMKEILEAIEDTIKS